jgi:hypothetical protein
LSENQGNREAAVSAPESWTVRRVAAWRAYGALVEADGIFERDDFSSSRRPAPSFCVRVISSENRFPLFGITR